MTTRTLVISAAVAMSTLACTGVAGAAPADGTGDSPAGSTKPISGPVAKSGGGPDAWACEDLHRIKEELGDITIQVTNYSPYQPRGQKMRVALADNKRFRNIFAWSNWFGVPTTRDHNVAFNVLPATNFSVCAQFGGGGGQGNGTFSGYIWY
ncbi:hypothetical protein [Amycolatopsis sp. NPDC004079]|uniref:hypothetical protein n=1 Tax=Amycolatopsis sp. NPDC004079 TaxID=3154549 RepID=UPI0033A3D277